ncbi:hypothetical protein MRF4_03230 [Methylobacterium radiotolerans]
MRGGLRGDVGTGAAQSRPGARRPSRRTRTRAGAVRRRFPAAAHRPRRSRAGRVLGAERQPARPRRSGPSYAVSFTLGFPLLTAGTIRYWIYARQGLSTAKIAALTVIAGFTFWLGMGEWPGEWPAGRAGAGRPARPRRPGRGRPGLPVWTCRGTAACS